MDRIAPVINRTVLDFPKPLGEDKRQSSFIQWSFSLIVCYSIWRLINYHFFYIFIFSTGVLYDNFCKLHINNPWITWCLQCVAFFSNVRKKKQKWFLRVLSSWTLKVRAQNKWRVFLVKLLKPAAENCRFV